MTTRRSRRSERGAVAILTAAMALLLFATGAFAVDIGNAVTRKRATVGSADMAALAGAAGLPATSTPTLQLVADYLNQNQPLNDGTSKSCNPDAGKPIVTSMLTDSNNANGEVTFPKDNQIHVTTPNVLVSFGMAGALGFHQVCVGSQATARIASGSLGMAPYYVTTSCSSGPQTLKDNSGGLSIPVTVPPLYPAAASDSNVSTVTSVTPSSIALVAAGNPDGPVVTLAGTRLGAADVDKVGFFNSDQTAPVLATPLASPAQSNTSVSVNVPNAVASYQDVWYIRVRNKTTQKWSTQSGAQSLQVGAAILSCDPNSKSGNFGSIDMPWGGNDLQDLVKNIQVGQRAPETLQPFPLPFPADNACQSDTRGVISTDALSKANTNCVQSVTGLKAGPASDGYLGASGSPKLTGGRLNVDTSSLCQTKAGQPARIKDISTGKTLNANGDLLSCFLTNDTAKLSDAVGYSGTSPLFVQDIWKSPRFVIVPVFEHDPNGTKWMPIKTFVPGFITDQPTGANRINNLQGATTSDGLVVTWSGSTPSLRAFKIFFFSMNALPAPPDGTSLQDYLGVGPKVIDLIN